MKIILRQYTNDFREPNNDQVIYDTESLSTYRADEIIIKVK